MVIHADTARNDFKYHIFWAVSLRGAAQKIPSKGRVLIKMVNILKNSINNFFSTNLWNPLGVRLTSTTGKIGSDSTFAISDIKTIENVLTRHARLLDHDSGFFRISRTPLSKETVRLASLQTMTLMSRVDCQPENIARILADLPEVEIRTRGGGQRLALRILRNAIVLPERPAFVHNFVDQYLEGSLIPDDIERRSWNKYSKVPLLRSSLSANIDLYTLPKVPLNESRDLLDVALSITSSTQEAAEIYQRLILASLGFLGVSIEYLLINLANRNPGHLDNTKARFYVEEVLRTSSPVWRLTRKSSRDIELSDISIPAESEIVLNVFAANHDKRFWDDASEFNPERWSKKGAASWDISFGKGERSCPVKRTSLEILTGLAVVCSEQYSITYRKKCLVQWPRYGTIAAPPRGGLTLLKLRDAKEL